MLCIFNGALQRCKALPVPKILLIFCSGINLYLDAKKLHYRHSGVAKPP